MKKWGAAFFDRLHPWQADQFPALIANRFGHMDALMARAGIK
jgi:hypothetical protein